MKKTNNSGVLSIRVNSNNEMEVVFKPVNGTVWMDRNELCKLFGCYMRDIDRCIGEIFGENRLRMEESCKYHTIAGGRRVCYDITAVNLNGIIAMAFRLATPEARTLRRWTVKRVTEEKEAILIPPGIRDNFRWN